MLDDDWNPPYLSLADEAKAQTRWILNHRADAVPPWAESEVTPSPLPEPKRSAVERPETVEQQVDAALHKLRAKPEPPPPPLPPLPPSPVPVGTRVRVLTGPINDYQRAETRDGTIVDWDGALVIQLDGDVEPRRFRVERVSPFDVWGHPVYPQRVTWIRGDAPPQLPPPPHGSTTRVEDQLKAEREDAFAVAAQPAVVMSRQIYPGMLG